MSDTMGCVSEIMRHLRASYGGRVKQGLVKSSNQHVGIKTYWSLDEINAIQGLIDPAADPWKAWTIQKRLALMTKIRQLGGWFRDELIETGETTND